MLLIGYIVLIFIFLMVTIQDILYRKIFVLFPVLVFMILLIVNYGSELITWQDLILNIFFIVINFLGLFIYFSLRFRKAHNPLDREIGLGDLLLFFSVVPLCPFYSFMRYFIIGLIFSAVIHFGVLFFKPKNSTVPLAGYLSIFTSLYIISSNFLTIHFLEILIPNG